MLVYVKYYKCTICSFIYYWVHTYDYLLYIFWQKLIIYFGFDNIPYRYFLSNVDYVHTIICTVILICTKMSLLALLRSTCFSYRPYVFSKVDYIRLFAVIICTKMSFGTGTCISTLFIAEHMSCGILSTYDYLSYYFEQKMLSCTRLFPRALYMK